MAHFSERINAYLALQKKVEGKLPSQKETKDPERIKIACRQAWPRASALARADAKAGDVFNGAAEQFRQIIREDAKDRSVRDAFAAMQEVPTPDAAEGERRLSGDGGAGHRAAADSQAAPAAARRRRVPVHGPRPDSQGHESQPDCRSAARRGAARWAASDAPAAGGARRWPWWLAVSGGIRRRAEPGVRRPQPQGLVEVRRHRRQRHRRQAAVRDRRAR